MPHERLSDHLRDVAFTTPTPFDEGDDSILHDELRDHAAWLTDAGARLLIPCGNTGEYYSLTNDERVAVVETTVDAAGGTASVVGGVGGSTKTAIELAEAYADAGADGIMIMHPVHTYQHETGLAAYFRAIVEATDLGVVLYRRGPEVTADLLRELATFENVVGIKYAVNDIAAFSAAVASTDADVVWSNGIAERFAPSFALEGAEGYTTGIGNFLPAETLSLQDALREADWDRARAIRDTLRPLEDLREEPGADSHIVAANNVPVVKYGMELAGFYGGPVREPLVDLSEEDRARTEEYVDRVKSSDVFGR